MTMPIDNWMRREDLQRLADKWAEENEDTGELFDVKQIRGLIRYLEARCEAPELRELWINKEEQMPRTEDMDYCGCVLAWHDGIYGANTIGVYGIRAMGVSSLEDCKQVRYWMPLPGKPKQR